MTDNELQLAIRESQRSFNELKNKLGLDAEIAVRQQGDKVFCTTVTRCWNREPVIFDGEFSYVRRKTLELWTAIVKSALELLETLPDDATLHCGDAPLRSGPTGDQTNAN